MGRRAASGTPQGCQGSLKHVSPITRGELTAKESETFILFANLAYDFIESTSFDLDAPRFELSTTPLLEQLLITTANRQMASYVQKHTFIHIPCHTYIHPHTWTIHSIVIVFIYFLATLYRSPLPFFVLCLLT